MKIHLTYEGVHLAVAMPALAFPYRSAARTPALSRRRSKGMMPRSPLFILLRFELLQLLLEYHYYSYIYIYIERDIYTKDRGIMPFERLLDNAGVRPSPCGGGNACHGRFPKFHRVFLGRGPGTLKSDIVSKNIHN